MPLLSETSAFCLGMAGDEPAEVIGDLRDRRRFDLSSLMERAGDRPDLRALVAEREEAQAEVRLGNGFRSPAIAPAFIYKRDQGDNVVQGGLSFTLPVFNRGQELQAVGLARTRRLDLEIAATKRAVSVEVRTAYDVYNFDVAAVEELERDAIPSLEENETLARRSFEEGEIGLAELLLIRRETFDLRTIYTERLLDATVAGIELESPSGGPAMKHVLTALVSLCLLFSSCSKKERKGSDEHVSAPATTEAKHTDTAILHIEQSMLRDLRITTTAVESRVGGESTAILGELHPNENAYAEIGAPIASRIVKLSAAPGQSVNVGQILAVLQNSEVGRARSDAITAQSRLDLARLTLDRKRRLNSERIVPQREVQDAEASMETATAELRAAKATLRSLGLSEDDAST